GEDVTNREEVVVGLQCVEDRVERGRHLGDLGLLVRRELVDVLVDRGRRLDLVLDAVDAGQEQGGEREVRVRRRVREAGLDALGLRVRARDRDTDRGR